MILKLALVALAGAAIGAAGAQAQTLEKTKQAGELSCGVSTGLPGFSNPDDQGNWSGIDVDFCRAVAAAVLGDPAKVRFVPLTAKERFTALQSGEVDILSRNTTWTATRDNSLGLTFPGVLNYYDGQGFLVNTSLGVNSATELDGAAICIQAGTTTELNLADYFRSQGMSYTPITFDTSDQTVQGFEAGRCDVLTSDTSQLAALRTKLPDPSSAVILPEIVSKEPLGPVVRQGDEQWLKIVRWTHYAMLNAEEFGLTSANIDDAVMIADMMANGSDEVKSVINAVNHLGKNPEVQRLIGTTGDFGQMLGLDNKWAYNIVKLVGNYGEVFEANVGRNTPLQLARGVNDLWTRGGLQYGPPIR